MKLKKEYVLIIGSLILLALGFYLVKTSDHIPGFMKALPYICIAIGCGIFGHNIGKIISDKTLKNQPDIIRQIEIDTHDERNIAIANKAKAKAYDMMTYVFATLMLIFALMEIDMILLLLFVFAYLFVELYAVYCRCKYEKVM